MPAWSKYVVVRRSPTLWIVIGNEHAAPAGNGIVLSTFTSVTAGAVALAVPAVTAASASTTTKKPRAFAFMLSLLRVRCRTLRRAEGRGGGRKADSRDAIF